MKTLNVRLLIILVAATLLVGGGVYGLYRFQIRRNAGVFLDQARKALAEAEDITGDSPEEVARKADRLQAAVRNYTWFVKMRPDDVDALEELGGLQMDVLQYPQALGSLERVVRLDPSRSKARRKLVDILMAFGRFEDARTHLQQYMLKEDPENAELHELLGVCQLMDGKNREAVKSLAAAIEHNPAQLQAYRYLAIALRFRLHEEAAADEWMQKMIQANPDLLEAHLLAGNYFQSAGAFEEAADHAAEALKLGPDNRDSLWLMAQCELSLDKLQAARLHAAKGMEKYPEHIPMYAIAADVAVREGKRDEAIGFIQRGLDATQRDPQLLWYLGNLLLDGGAIDETAKVVKELRATKFSDARITYLDARIALQRRQWREAARMFERIRSDLAQWPSLLKQADYWRGRSYQQLGDRQRAEAAYRNSLSVDRVFGPARAALADLMAAGGDFDEAVGEFGQMLRLADPTPAGLAHYARLSILRNLQLPADQRNWSQVRQALDDLDKAEPDSLDGIRLRAEMLLAQDQAAAAEKLVREALAKKPDELGLWLTQVALAVRAKQWDEADKLLAEAKDRFQDAMLLRLARARCLASRYGAKSSDQVRELADGIDHYPEAERQQLLLGLMSTAQQIGDWEFMKQLAQKLVKEQPDNLGVRVALFEQAMRENDMAAMREELAAIKVIQGEGPQWLYGQAVVLSLGARDGADKRLDEALGFLQRAMEQRPRWPRVPLLAAGIFERKGQFEEALDRYREAIDMGEANPNAFRRFIQLLAKQGHMEEAQQRMQQLDRLGVDLSSEIERLRGGVLANVGQLELALDHARDAAANSQDHADHLWLGRLAAGMAQREETSQNDEAAQRYSDEAKQAFLRAVELAEDAPDARLSLIQFYVGAGQKDLAKAQLEQINRHLPEQQRPLVLAAAHELLGEPKQAEAEYLAAVKANPKDPVSVRALAEFYWRTNRPQQAEELAQRIVQGDQVDASNEDRRWARRLLARILTARGGYQNL
ncbi:MAG: tetratricopeptide repeat protein, partial [Patescibacteria group bacterium]|nr:tetratricopeptide repeat protein [Patescibacteria group bacterium]